MSSLYIENDSSYYLLMLSKYGSLYIEHYNSMKRVNSCIKRNGSPPIIYETLYKQHFVDKVFNIIKKLIIIVIPEDDLMIKEIYFKMIDKQIRSLLGSYNGYFCNREEEYNSVLDIVGEEEYRSVLDIVGEFPS